MHKLPCFWRGSREFGRDWFAEDCLHHHSVRPFWRVLSRLGKAPSFPSLSWLKHPTLGREQPFSGLSGPFSALRLRGPGFVSKRLRKRWSVHRADAGEMLGGEESFLGGPGIRQVRQSRKPLSRELHWMVAGEDGVDQLGRQEGQRQDAADLGRINAVGGCDVGEASDRCRRSAAEDSDASAEPDRREPDRERGFAAGRLLERCVFRHRACAS